MSIFRVNGRLLTIGGSGNTYSSLALAYRTNVIANGGTVSDARLTLLDTLIFTPQAATLAKLDYNSAGKGRLLIYCAENQQSARTNLLNSSFTATLLGTPVFTANSYYTGSVGNALNTNYNPSLLSLPDTNITSFHILNNSTLDQAKGIINNTTVQNSMYFYSNAGLRGRVLNAGEQNAATITDRIGLNSLRRNGTSMIFNDKDTQQTIVMAATGSFSNNNYYELGLNNQANTLNASYAGQIICGCDGAYITDGELTSLYSAIRTYVLTVNPALAI